MDEAMSAPIDDEPTAVRKRTQVELERARMRFERERDDYYALLDGIESTAPLPPEIREQLRGYPERIFQEAASMSEETVGALHRVRTTFTTCSFLDALRVQHGRIHGTEATLVAQSLHALALVKKPEMEQQQKDTDEVLAIRDQTVQLRRAAERVYYLHLAVDLHWRYALQSLDMTIELNRASASVLSRTPPDGGALN